MAKKLTSMQVCEILKANPKACYQTLMAIIDQDDNVEAEAIIAAARPKCGYDCEGGECFYENH